MDISKIKTAADLQAMQRLAAVPQQQAQPQSYAAATLRGIQLSVVHAADGERVLAIRRQDGRPLPGGVEAYEFPLAAGAAVSVGRALVGEEQPNETPRPATFGAAS